MKICYTVCSLNRLGQVLALASSVRQYNPDYSFVACLADRIDNRINPDDYPAIRFLEFPALRLSNEKDLSDRYNIFELSCALKPFFGLHLMEEHQPEVLVYLDTDIYVYSSFAELEEILTRNPIVITPHFVSPPPADGKLPLERDVLNSGLYNGGFVALANDPNSLVFLKWWKERLTDQGFNSVSEGMMVDQLWLNLVPLYFKQALVFNHPAFNMAYWNLHERSLSIKNEVFFADNDPLVFFHFSGYRISAPETLSLHQNRIREKDNSALQMLLAQYHRVLEAFEFEKFLPFQPLYGRTKTKKQSFGKRIVIQTLAKFGYALERIRKV